MGSIVGGIVAIVAGGALAVATTLGVVNTVNGSPSDTGSQVVDYGGR